MSYRGCIDFICNVDMDTIFKNKDKITDTEFLHAGYYSESAPVISIVVLFLFLSFLCSLNSIKIACVIAASVLIFKPSCLVITSTFAYY